MNNINDIIQRNPMSPYQIIAVVICTVLYMLDGFDVLVMAFTAAPVSQEWGLQETEVGTLLSAGLFGMAGGSLLLAPLADRFGRRALIMTCLLIISGGMLLSSLSQNMLQLALLRLVTGLGIGGMLATLTVVVSEYSSDKWRNFNVILLCAGYPIGAVVGGVIATVLLGKYGWRSVFLFGSLASFIMTPLVLWRLPESLDFLLSKRPPGALEKINTQLTHMGQQPVAALPAPPAKNAIQASGPISLLAASIRRSTVLIWLSFFMVMYSFYFVLSWTPKLLVTAGLSEAEGISGGVLINLGGIVGGLLLGYISSRIAVKKLAAFYMLATAILMVIFGLIASKLNVALGLGVIIGFFLFGSMFSLYALTPGLYVASIRTTGMGWAIGIGRLGAILSPLIAGILLDRGWQGSSLFIVFALPLLCSLAAVCALDKPAAGDG